MSSVFANCGCEIELEISWDYGCAGDCCSGSDYVSGASIVTTCFSHTVDSDS